MNTSTPNSQRITVVDSLRGFAVCGIIIIHFLEHMNFYRWPEPSAFEQGLWDTIFYLGASKMYAIFSLLFGLSCYIMHHNQEKNGYDFRPRFAWRMVLLFLWGLFDLVFFNGDLLVTYAALGLLLLPFVKAPDKVVYAAIALLFIQPVEVVYIILGLINPETQPMDVGLRPLWGALYEACQNGGFLDVAKANLASGLQINFGWALEHGRLTQTLFAFMVGMMLGRKRLFINEGNNLQVMRKICIWSVVAFAITQLLVSFVPDMLDTKVIKFAVNIMFSAWRNFSMVAFYVSGLTLLYYTTGLRRALDHFVPYGKISLTNYILQSVVGGFLFYNWGLSLWSVCSHGYSFLLSIAYLIVLYFFCRYWTSHFRRGPLEEIWYRLTWIGHK